MASQAGCFGHSTVYKTAKLAQIHSPTLSILHSVARIAVVAYVAGSLLLIQQRHFRHAELTGVGRLQLRGPTVSYCDPDLQACSYNFSNNADLPYCDEYSGQEVVQGERLPCKQVGDRAMTQFGFGAAYATPLFVPTRMSYQEMKYFANDSWQAIGDVTSYFVADIERYIVIVEHLAWGPVHVPFRSAEDADVPGYSVMPDGTECPIDADCPWGINALKFGGDAVTLGTLFKLAGLHLTTARNRRNESVHRQGMAILVSIDYQNDGRSWRFWRTPPLRYKMSVRKLPAQEMKRTQLDVTAAGARVMHWVYGVQILLSVHGEYRWPALPEFILLVVAAVALLLLSDWMVDGFALNFWAHKVDFEFAKLDATHTFDSARRYTSVLGARHPADDGRSNSLDESEMAPLCNQFSDG